jgi:hypothetical protein
VSSARALTDEEVELSDPTAVILRFEGNPDDLIERFEKARQLWIDAREDDYSPPAFYAACKTKAGIVIVTGWPTDEAHKAFGRDMRPHLEAVGMGRPDGHEHLRIEKLGWT